MFKNSTLFIYSERVSFNMRHYFGSSRMTQYATSRKVTGSLPDEVAEFFNLPKPSSRIIALGLPQPLKEKSSRASFWGQCAAGAIG
jgi:hypothetical protein